MEYSLIPVQLPVVKKKVFGKAYVKKVSLPGSLHELNLSSVGMT